MFVQIKPTFGTIPLYVCMLRLAAVVIESRSRNKTSYRENNDVMHALVSPSQTEMHPQTLGSNYIEL